MPVQFTIEDEPQPPTYWVFGDPCTIIRAEGDRHYLVRFENGQEEVVSAQYLKLT